MYVSEFVHLRHVIYVRRGPSNIATILLMYVHKYIRCMYMLRKCNMRPDQFFYVTSLIDLLCNFDYIQDKPSVQNLSVWMLHAQTLTFFVDSYIMFHVSKYFCHFD